MLAPYASGQDQVNDLQNAENQVRKSGHQLRVGKHVLNLDSSGDAESVRYWLARAVRAARQGPAPRGENERHEVCDMASTSETTGSRPTPDLSTVTNSLKQHGDGMTRAWQDFLSSPSSRNLASFTESARRAGAEGRRLLRLQTQISGPAQQPRSPLRQTTGRRTP